MANLVDQIDDLGFTILDNVRAGIQHQHLVRVLRSFFAVQGMFPPWIYKILGSILSRWLKCIRKAISFPSFFEELVIDESSVEDW